MKKGGDFLSNLQRVGPGPEEGGERETEANRVKEKLTLGITPNQAWFCHTGNACARPACAREWFPL